MSLFLKPNPVPQKRLYVSVPNVHFGLIRLLLPALTQQRMFFSSENFTEMRWERKIEFATNKFSSFSFIPKNHVPLLSKRAFQYFIEASCYSEISPFSSINCATKREFEAFCCERKSIYEGDVLAREAEMPE